MLAVSLLENDRLMVKAREHLDQGDLLRGFLGTQDAAAFLPVRFSPLEAAAKLYNGLPLLHPDLAIEAIERALELDPWSPNLLGAGVYQAVRAGRWEQAVDYMLRLTRIDGGWQSTNELWTWLLSIPAEQGRQGWLTPKPERAP